jgi:hypothetical protein
MGDEPEFKPQIWNHQLTRIVVMGRGLGRWSDSWSMTSRLSCDFAPIGAIGYLSRGREYPESVFKRMVHEQEEIP